MTTNKRTALQEGLKTTLAMALWLGVAQLVGGQLLDVATGELGPITARNVEDVLNGKRMTDTNKEGSNDE